MDPSVIMAAIRLFEMGAKALAAVRAARAANLMTEQQAREASERIVAACELLGWDPVTPAQPIP